MSTFSFDDLWQKLCSADESVIIEAKRGRRVSAAILETISAFSNEPGRGGGYLLLGVTPSEMSLFPDYEIVGVDEPDRIQCELATRCRTDLQPPVRPV